MHGLKRVPSTLAHTPCRGQADLLELLSGRYTPGAHTSSRLTESPLRRLFRLRFQPRARAQLQIRCNLARAVKAHARQSKPWPCGTPPHLLPRGSSRLAESCRGASWASASAAPLADDRARDGSCGGAPRNPGRASPRAVSLGAPWTPCCRRKAFSMRSSRTSRRSAATSASWGSTWCRRQHGSHCMCGVYPMSLTIQGPPYGYQRVARAAGQPGSCQRACNVSDHAPMPPPCLL